MRRANWLSAAQRKALRQQKGALRQQALQLQREAQAQQEFDRVADFDISQLPAVEMPPAEAVPQYGGLLMTLQSWMLAGAQTPIGARPIGARPIGPV